MRKKTKIWLITAASLVFLGLAMVISVMIAYQWDFTRLNTEKFETSTHVVSEEFHSISINANVADISFVPSEDGKCKVVCCGSESTGRSVAVQSGTLTISEVDMRKWYEHIGISIGTPKITVYLPDREYDMLTVRGSTGDVEIPKTFGFDSIDILASTGDVKNYASATGILRIETDTGDIHVEKVSADTLDVSVSTGGITLADVACKGDAIINVSTGKANITNVRCKNLLSGGNTGSISLKNVIAEEIFSIVRTTGYVRFDGCDAADIFVETDTGDVTGTFLSEKVFILETDTGSIDAPKSITGGRCEIITDTGDIELDIA